VGAAGSAPGKIRARHIESQAVFGGRRPLTIRRFGRRLGNNHWGKTPYFPTKVSGRCHSRFRIIRHPRISARSGAESAKTKQKRARKLRTMTGVFAIATGADDLIDIFESILEHVAGSLKSGGGLAETGPVM